MTLISYFSTALGELAILITIIVATGFVLKYLMEIKLVLMEKQMEEKKKE